MQSKIIQKLEFSANILIILVAILLGYFLIQKAFFQPQNNPPPLTEIVKGTKISLPETDWNANQKTLILVLQKSCKFCTESMPFYKKLVEKSKNKGLKLIAVLPDSREESQNYLKENGVEIREIRQSRPDAVNAEVTPTLILVDGKGEVLNFWIGKLPAAKEAEVIENL